jgi:hypothetical protein
MPACLACDLHYIVATRKRNTKEMLRITVSESANGKTIKLEGKVAGPWVEVLSRTWRDLAAAPGSQQVQQVDLRDVGFVDLKGRELLREIHQQSLAIFVSDSPLTKQFADDAMLGFPKNGEEGV